MEVRTRDEAIAAVDQAFQKWATEFAGLLVQAQNEMTVASDGVLHVLRKCANEVAAIEALLGAAPDGRHAELEMRLAKAREVHERAARGAARVREVQERLARLGRTVTRLTSSDVPAARARLGAMARALDGYRVGGAGVQGGASRSDGVATHPSSSLAAIGLAELDVASADLDENPILDDAGTQGTFGKGGLSRADFRWAVQTWNDVVGPGVAAGKTRDHFAERDAHSGAVLLRRTADVYDMFLGSDRIRVDRQPDGSLNIINGRHRFQIARELGIKTLPGQVAD